MKKIKIFDCKEGDIIKGSMGASKWILRILHKDESGITYKVIYANYKIDVPIETISEDNSFYVWSKSSHTLLDKGEALAEIL